MRDLVLGLAGNQIAIVGDAILDEYLVGQPTRISREDTGAGAGVQPGVLSSRGAANPAVNVRRWARRPS